MPAEFALGATPAAKEPPSPLSRASLRAWAVEAGLSSEERLQRQALAKRITDQFWLKPWQKTLFIKGDFDISENCNHLSSLPPGLQVEKNLFIANCDNLGALPEKCFAGASLVVERCNKLTSLPADLWTPGDVKVISCAAFTTLGLENRGRLDGALILSNNPALVSLPQNLSVGALLIEDCGITALPARLRVQGDLIACGNESLVSVGEGLYVQGTLSLSGCVSLAALPENIYVGKNLSLSYCRSLISLPAALLGAGEHLPISPWQVPDVFDFSFSGISGDDQETFLATYAGRRFPQAFAMYEANREEIAPEIDPDASLQEVLSVWWSQETSGTVDPQVVSAKIEVWPMLPQQEELLRNFLRRLTETEDYSETALRPAMAARVKRLLAAMQNDESLRELCFERIEEALESCGDRVAMAMNQLEMFLRVQQAEAAADGGQALEALGLSLLRLEAVHEHAAQMVQRDPDYDAIEIYLRFETGLREELDLPVAAQSMLYSATDVTDEELQKAASKARAAVADPARVQRFFSTWEPWQSRQREAAAQKFVYASLPARALAATRVNDEPICPFTQEALSALGEPVALGTPERPRVYEAADFLEWWKRNGNGPAPAPRGPVALSDLWRPARDR